MTNSPLDALEIELRELSRLMTDPREGECLLCYVYRMLGEFNCSGLHWATRYRDLAAPRATGLERRLARVGGYCDCEILLNGYQYHDRYLDYDEFGDVIEPDLGPDCLRVRRGSTQGCGLWVRCPHSLRGR